MFKEFVYILKINKKEIERDNFLLNFFYISLARNRVRQFVHLFVLLATFYKTCSWFLPFEQNKRQATCINTRNMQQKKVPKDSLNYYFIFPWHSKAKTPFFVFKNWLSFQMNSSSKTSKLSKLRVSLPIYHLWIKSSRCY